MHNNIERIRRSKNITASEISEKIGKDVSFVSRREKGRKLDITELILFSKALDVSPLEILNKEQSLELSTLLNTDIETEERILLSKIRKLSKTKKGLLLKIINAI